MDETIYTKPVLKWAGGKSQLLGEIIPRMPETYNNYIEPFFGSGAVYFCNCCDHQAADLLQRQPNPIFDR